MCERGDVEDDDDYNADDDFHYPESSDGFDEDNGVMRSRQGSRRSPF